ncbi:protein DETOXIFICATION 44, chloroplastic isoform X1 [Macadamia integrifolia]|uniref:protein DETOXIFICATION 44, chloroplastic isoform X1 n=1 Tax=Macadamia integrifolia TaxID=60698 RepID=UPI001C4F0530|nr:protein DETOXIFICATION 44, chloroplastic isoform X1 [Macadamia integrifolia]
MASALSHPLLCIYSPHQNRSCFCCSTTRPYKSPILKRTANSASRLRAIPGSSPPKDHVSPLEDPAKESKVPIKRDGIDVSMENPKMNPSPSSSFLNSDSRLLRGLRMCGELFKIDNLGLEILSIAVPAALSLAADPIASLVDTAFVGHIGSVELAAVGVSISVFNLVSKLFNIPLLNITTSFVAEEQALVMERIDASSTSGASNGGFSSGSEPLDASDYKQKKRFLPAVSTSLALAAGIGIAEATALSFGSGFLMNIMGIPVDSPMRLPAEHFLTLRALGAPPVVVALAAQGTFRGFMDTKTPLFAIGAGNFLNAILDFILIFLFGIGIGGAAIATVISEYVKNVIFDCFYPSLGVKHKSSPLATGFSREETCQISNICCHFAGGLLIGRTIAVLGTMTLSTSMAAQEGPIPMAGHQICLQVWLAISLLNDALALAGQALLASSYSQGNYRQSRIVIYRVLQIGLVTGVALAVILFLAFGTFSGLFSTDTAVLEIACSGVLFVAGSQPMNALAFVFDGLYYGVSDFAYAAYSMVFVGLTSSVFLLVAAPMFGLAGVWAGLFLFMTLRVAAGFWRLGSQGGPWKMIWLEMDRSKE